MIRNRHIAPIADEGDDRSDEAGSSPAPPWDEEWSVSFAAEAEQESGSRGRRIADIALPTLAIAAVLGWTAFFLWAHQDQMMARPAPRLWAGWITSWAVPVLLVLTLWLLALRHSRRESRRFADVARALSDESGRLEDRLLTVNRELSLAREFLTAQGRELESFGRMAGERLSTHAERLQDLVRDNGAQVDGIASVSTTAVENMDRLRNDLPVIANAARDVTNQIASAGRTADGHLGDLIEGFSRLNEFGQASERQVHSLRERIDEALAAYVEQTDAFANVANARFAALAERSAGFRATLEGHEVEALAAIRRRADILAEEMAASRDAMHAEEAGAAEAVRSRFILLREESASITEEIAAGEGQAAAALQSRLDMLREESAGLAGAIFEREQNAAAGLRARIAGLRRECIEAAGAIAEVEEGAASALRMRLHSLRHECEQIAAAIAESEGEAVEGLRSRLRLVRDDSARVSETILRGEQEALAGAASRLVQLRDELGTLEDTFDERLVEFHRQLAQRRADAEAHGEREMERIRRRLGEFDAQFTAQNDAQLALNLEMAEQADALAARLADLQQEMAHVARDGRIVRDELAHSVETLAAHLEDSQAALAGTDETVTRVTDASVRLLELVQASAQHSRERLPQALAEAERRLSALRAEGESLQATIEQAGSRSEQLAGTVASARREGTQAINEFDAFHSQLAACNREHLAKLAELRAEIAAVARENEETATTGQNQLSAAIAKLGEATRTAVEALETRSARSVSQLAERVGEEAANAVGRAVQESSAEAVAKLEEATSAAMASSREAALLLRDEVAKVDELAGNLEARVAQARERAEEQVDNDFARRVALITESLNSNAIDLAKALSNEVTDTAWASYLRGDRGIFTRRAVRLLENSESRTIAEIYETDRDFREHVSRYVHDFEAMLRTLLSTRDGHALSVTLLSSDMGKLYVMLAQAIDRLRD